MAAEGNPSLRSGYHPTESGASRGYNNTPNGLGNSLAQQWKFNGQQFNQDLGSNWYEMDMRSLDPAIGRWMVIDPVTHYDFSPYNAMDNNPIAGADPDGADTINHAGGTLFTGTEAVAAFQGLQYLYGAGRSEKEEDDEEEEDEFDDWKPVLNDDGSVSYVAENGDSDETFAEQYGVSVNQARQLIGTDNVKAGITKVSGTDVSNMLGTEVLKLNLMTLLATDQRVIDQVIFAIQHSNLADDDYWHSMDYFKNVLKVDQNFKQYKGKLDTGNGMIDVGLFLQWNVSTGGFFGTDHPSVFDNRLNYTDNSQRGTIFTGTMAKESISKITFRSGVDYQDGIKWRGNRWSSSQFVTRAGNGGKLVNSVFNRFSN